MGSIAGRIAVAVALTVGFYVVALGLVAAFGYAIYSDLTSSRHVHGRLLIGCAIGIGVIVWSVAPRIDRFPDPGVRLQRDSQPTLWRFIDEIARATAQAPPAELFLVGDVNAFVAERGGAMGIGSRRVMGIGLPLLQLLTVDELRAVLAHEFGHFHGGDTKLGPWIYKTRGAVLRTVNNFARVGSVLHLPFRWYAQLFLRVTQAVSRRQELAADALSVAVAGPAAAKSALQAVSAGAPLFDIYLRNEFSGAMDSGVRPPLIEGFRRFLGSPRMAELRGAFGARALAAKVDPYDTHPPLAERLAAVDRCTARGDAGAATGGGETAIRLVSDLPQLEVDMLCFMSGNRAVRTMRTLEWDAVPEAVLPRIWQRFAFDEAVLFPALTVAEFAAQRSHLAEHGNRIYTDVPKDERAGRVKWVLSVLLAFRLHENGFRIETSPGYPIVLRRGDRELRLFDLLDDDEHGISDAAWRKLCAAEGIADLPLAGPAARPSSAA